MRSRRSYAFPPYRGTRGWILQDVVDRLFDQRCVVDKLSIAVAPHASGRAASRLRGSTMWGWPRSCPRNQGRPMLRLCDTDGSPTFIEPLRSSPPDSSEASSGRISPDMLVVTMTSNRSGVLMSRAATASTINSCTSTSPKSLATLRTSRRRNRPIA